MNQPRLVFNQKIILLLEILCINVFYILENGAHVIFDKVCEQHEHYLVEGRCGICLVDDDNLVNSKAE